jgi:hypothetical protein
MRLSVSAAVICALFALQVTCAHGFQLSPEVMETSGSFPSVASVNSDDRRSDLSAAAWLACVQASPGYDASAATNTIVLECGALEVKVSSGWCTLDAEYTSGSTVYSPGDYCWADKGTSHCCETNDGAIAGIVIGCIVGLTLSIVACAWCCKCCCFKRKEQPAQPGVVMMQPGYVMPK